jgi:hypothetical protein
MPPMPFITFLMHPLCNVGHSLALASTLLVSIIHLMMVIVL